jgi:hypothetical protein
MTIFPSLPGVLFLAEQHMLVLMDYTSNKHVHGGVTLNHVHYNLCVPRAEISPLNIRYGLTDVCSASRILHIVNICTGRFTGSSSHSYDLLLEQVFTTIRTGEASFPHSDETSIVGIFLKRFGFLPGKARTEYLMMNAVATSVNLNKGGCTSTISSFERSFGISDSISSSKTLRSEPWMWLERRRSRYLENLA